MNTISNDDTLRIETITLLMGSVMSGLIARNTVADGDKAGRIRSSMHEAEKHRDLCFSITNSLMAVNENDFPSEHSEVRMKSVASLFGAAVSGLITSGETPRDALNRANRQRDIFFMSSESILRRQMEMEQPARQESPRMPNLHEWRARRSESVSLELEPIQSTDSAPSKMRLR